MAGHSGALGAISRRSDRSVPSGCEDFSGNRGWSAVVSNACETNSSHATAENVQWTNVQKRFQKLNLHQKKPDEFNIWTYQVKGERRINRIKGLLIQKPQQTLGLFNNTAPKVISRKEYVSIRRRMLAKSGYPTLGATDFF
jgi:hypothetical protein